MGLAITNDWFELPTSAPCLRGRCIKSTTTGKVGPCTVAGERALGIALQDAPGPGVATFRYIGPVDGRIGAGGCTVGDTLATAADGRLVVAGGLDVPVATALETAAANTFARVCVLGAGSSSASIPPLTRTLYVDAGSIATSPDGSIAKPFPTITSALAVIPAATTVAESRTVWELLIVNGTYDEELTIDITGKRISLLGLGPWNLGLFDAALDWAPSGTRRNVTVTGDASSIGGIRCGLVIGTLASLGERSSTHQSYTNGARISGQIDLRPINSASFEVDLNAEVFGTTGTSAGNSLVATFNNPILQVYLYNSRFRGKVNLGTNGNFQHASRCRFDGLLTVPNYSLVDTCRINDGMTVASAANAGLFPDGIVNTYWATGPKTFTGPALSLRLDAYSNYWFKTNLGAVAGGATKVILGDLVP